MKHEQKGLHVGEAAQAPIDAPVEKLPYEEPELVVHGKVEKMTLQTGI